MKFTKEELLKIYVAMADSSTMAHKAGEVITPLFQEIQEKIRKELTE